MEINKQNLEPILKDRFGLAAFREGQLEAICTLMEKNRLLCIQPTGHGKSFLLHWNDLIDVALHGCN